MAKRGKSKVSLANIRALAEPTMSLADENAPTPQRMMKLPGVTIASSVATRGLEAVFPSKHEKPVGKDRVVRMQSPLDRYALAGRLDEKDAARNRDLRSAGDLLRQHWYQGGLGDAVGAIDLNRAGGGGGSPAWLTPTSESVAYHRQRFRLARDLMERGHFDIVFAVCCQEATLEEAGRTAGFGNRDGAAAVALDRLRRGLAYLATLYGICRPDPANDNAAIDVTIGGRLVSGDAVDEIIEKLMAKMAEDPAYLGSVG